MQAAKFSESRIEKMDLARWRQLMIQWKAPECDEFYSKLLAAYSEPHRRYHTTRHIDDCLEQFDKVSSFADAPEEVELVLWFHDAVYKPRSFENELKSAEWAARFLRFIGIAGQRMERVYQSILATKHAEDAVLHDAVLVVDIDLSILGSDPEKFKSYEQAIRKEYKWVPRALYCRKRIELLRSFLDRPTIYGTEHFQDRYETPARENLRWAIQNLRE